MGLVLGTPKGFQEAKKNLFLEYMYNGIAGTVARCQFVKYDGIKSVFKTNFYYQNKLIYKNRYKDVEDVYVSMNSFLSSKARTVDNLKRLNALYLDLDIYNTGLTHDEVLSLLDKEYIGKRIPEPTFIIDSGRGMYLIWKIDEDRNALPRWTRVQRYLYEQCVKLGADAKTLDGARIFRVPSSINTKNGKTVSVMRFTDKTYTLYELIKAYDIKCFTADGAESKRPKKKTGGASARQRVFAESIAQQLNIDLPDFSSYSATHEYISKNAVLLKNKLGAPSRPYVSKKLTASEAVRLKGIVNDICELFKYRKGENCCREYALFLTRLFIGEMTGDYAFALSATHKLNNSFDVPYSKAEVEILTKSAETKLKSGETYKYSNATIINRLSISSEELSHLSFLNRKRNNVTRKESNRRAYEKRLAKSGKTLKRDAIKARRQAVLAMIEQGYNRAYICDALNISLATYTKDKAVLIADGLINRAQRTIRKEITAIKENISNRTERLFDVLIAMLKSDKENQKNNKVETTTFLSPLIKEREYAKHIPPVFSFLKSILCRPDCSLSVAYLRRTVGIVGEFCAINENEGNSS